MLRGIVSPFFTSAHAQQPYRENVVPVASLLLLHHQHHAADGGIVPVTLLLFRA